MKLLLPLLSLVLLMPMRASEPLTEPGAVLTAGESEAAWRPLFAALAAQEPVYSRFIEHRYFSFRKAPVVLYGEMRFSAAHGLSLHYLAPEEQLAIADNKGLVLRNARGRTRTIAADPHSTNPGAALLPVMRFDLTALLLSFKVQAARNGAAWRLDFTPHDRTLARALGTIVVTGENETVRRLEFAHSATQRIEIIMGETRTHAVFDAEEIKRFFR